MPIQDYITPEKAEVYETVGLVIGRLFLTFIGGIVFFGLAIWLALHPSWPVATVEGILGILGGMFKFYFPAVAKKKTLAKKAVK